MAIEHDVMPECMMPDGGYACAGYAELVQEVRKLRTEVRRRWISVNVRMPPRDIPVLVCQQIYGRRIMVWNGMNWRCEEPGDTLPPHHWMPLPIPPESKEDSNGRV